MKKRTITAHMGMAAAAAIAVAVSGLGGAACGSTAVPMSPGHKVGPVPTGLARVAFMKPSALKRHEETYITDGTELIGVLQGGQKFIADLAAGHHIFMGMMHSTQVVDAELTAGMTYFVVVRNYFNYWKMHPIAPGGDQWSMRRRWFRECALVTLPASVAQRWSEENRARNARILSRIASGQNRHVVLLKAEYGDDL